MAKKLTYFELNGLAESIRYILYYTGQKFEDVRHDLRTWPIKEIKDGLPFGQFPVFEEDGRVLHQSIAIARYVAAHTELLPSDPWQQAVLDAAVLTIYDFDEHFYFSRFEKQLKENNGHFGGKLSWADFILVGIVECSNLYLEDNIEKNYPQISALVKKIQTLRGVKDYIRDRKPYDFFDYRIDYQSWPDKKIKDSLPYGQLPLYHEGGRVLHQSLAIARYLAANSPLLPSDPWEQAVLDAAVLTIYDYHKRKQLQFLSWADIIFVGIIETSNFYFKTNIEKNYPEITELIRKKLQYFDLPGLAEGIRYILHYTGQKFHDDRQDYKSWPNKEIKDARYLAANTTLLPSDPWEQALLDAAVFTIYDYHKHAIAAATEKDPKKKEELIKNLLSELLDFYFSRFEKQIKENNGFLGKKLSWADLVFVGIIETSNMFFKTNIEKNYPAITELINKVKNLPGIKEYVKNRKPYLTYFDANCLAESIRYILHYTGQKFEDVRYDHRTWPIKEVKDNVIDLAHATDSVAKEELRNQIYYQHLDFYFPRFEKQLKENNGYFGGKLSWADFILIGIVEFTNLCLKDNIEKNYPQILALMKKIQTLPGVKDYIHDRKP
ncbi:Glutathione S-transferase sigma 3 [Operophtera brumata]|uniref:glutathione transferase n=1 Tax=Operophtera brumata TaxID=104452 RepID=A0A0L7LJE5_OPEBR|nr:Glutathione S-transferase sigma 3 [Operophtera brumata]